MHPLPQNALQNVPLKPRATLVEDVFEFKRAKVSGVLKMETLKIGKITLEFLLAAALSTVVTACKPNGKDPIFFPNDPPVVTSTPVTEAIENELYTYDVDATDPEGKPLIYSLTTAPIGMTIDPNTGLIQWTPVDADASQSHNIDVLIDDGKKTTIHSFLVYAKDKSTITFSIKDVTDDTDLSGMEVKVGTYSADTDGTGVATLVDVVEGIYPIEVNDKTGLETNYFTYTAGKLISDKNKKDSGKLDNLVLKVIPTTLEAADTKQDVLDHIAYCIRTRYDVDKDIKKWETCPEFRIYLREFSTGNPVDPAKIAIAKDIINNEIEKVDPLFTNPVITEIDATRPVGPVQDDYIDVTWNDDAIAKGINAQNFNNYTITGGFASCKTDQIKDVWMQELTENILCGGESNTYSSVLNDPLTTSDYTTIDNKLWKIHQNRPKGNKDLDTDNNHDVNPNGYIINP